MTESDGTVSNSGLRYKRDDFTQSSESLTSPFDNIVNICDDLRVDLLEYGNNIPELSEQIDIFLAKAKAFLEETGSLDDVEPTPKKLRLEKLDGKRSKLSTKCKTLARIFIEDEQHIPVNYRSSASSVVEAAKDLKKWLFKSRYMRKREQYLFKTIIQRKYRH